MTRDEFAAVLAYLSAGTTKPIPATTAEVYWDLLSDLPQEAVRFAAKRALMESEYPVLPPVGTLRQLAVAALGGPDRITPIEAYGIFRQAIVRFTYTREAEAMAWLPPAIRDVARAMGWQNVCASLEPEEINRAQFCRAYDAVVARRDRENLLPAPMKEFLREIGQMPSQQLEFPGRKSG